MINPVELREIASNISLILDNPESVKKQVKQINLAQKQLRLMKKELSKSIRGINQAAAQSNADTFLSVLNDIAGNRKLAGQARARQRRIIEKNKKQARQPYIELQMELDQLILEGDRLKLLAEEYYLDPEGVVARIQAEEEQRQLKEQEQLKYANELRQQQEEKVKHLIKQFGGESGFLAAIFACIAFIPVVFGFGLLIQGLEVNWFFTAFWLFIFIASISFFIKHKFK